MVKCMAYIKGMFIQDIFSNQSNGYTVGLLRVKEASEEENINKVVTFTGIFNELKYKMVYLMNGEFVSHSKYGRQFQVSSYELVMPTDSEELVEFLSSDLFPIGEKTALKIVKKLGNKAVELILDDWHVLDEIPRLSDDKKERIAEILIDYQATSGIVVELGKLGFSTKDALAILKKYNTKSMNVVSDNIYRLKDDIDISFLELDKIARNYGYQLNDERRLEALVINMMNVLTFSSGDTYLNFDVMYDYLVKNTDNIDEETVHYILMKLEKLGKIKIISDRYYLKEFYDAEEYIVSRLSKLNDMTRRKLPKLESKINQLELVSGITYDESQRNAIVKSLNNNLTIITGGPGTGKTTIIKCIVKLLLELCNVKMEKLALLAPTGRAARKLMDTTGVPAYTIHKYLKWDMDSNSFQVDEYNPNKEEYIIVDEASMIDTILMASLLKGTLLHAKYIIVGDYYQLPSVSQGQVLKDLIDSGCLDVVRLNTLYRQSEDSYIPTLAHQIKDKEITEEILGKYDDYNFITCSDSEIMEIIKDIVTKAIKKGYTDRDIQVLAPLYKTTNGIDNLNKMLKDLMNPKSPEKNEITSGDVTYREGDKVLQLVNDSDNFISNGDIGYIESIVNTGKGKNKKTEMIIDFDGTKVTYTPKDFINITLGYAISVHKSQGGEFKMVIMPFCNSFRRMLYNKLVYTAVTRAKQALILVGDASAFVYGIRNDYVDRRKTTIRELLEKKYN